MVIVRIQHAVGSFDAWKRAFDADPLDRRGSGVRRWVVHRTVDEPTRVAIDLELPDLAAARAFVERLEKLWQGPGKAVMQDPAVWILEPVETVEHHAPT